MTKTPWPNFERARRCMKPKDWPPVDQAAWKAARAPGTILDPGGGACAWRAATINDAEHTYGRFLTYLELDGRLDPLARPGARVTPETIAGYVGVLRGLENAPMTVFRRVSGLADMIRVLEPGVDFFWLDRVAANLEVLAVPSRNKANRVVSTGALVDLGFMLMREAGREKRPIEAAAKRQLGLQIALLALTPVRRRNFTGIEIDRHLIRVGDGFRLVFPAEEVKNHKLIDAPVPPVLTAAIERHLQIDRPLLVSRSITTRARNRPAGEALWLSRFGSALNGNRIYDAIRLATKAHFGHPINLHLFRDCAATTIADADPAHVGSTRPVLGHGNDETAAKYYNQASGIDAARKHQEVMRASRAGGAEPRSKPGRKQANK